MVAAERVPDIVRSSRRPPCRTSDHLGCDHLPSPGLSHLRCSKLFPAIHRRPVSSTTLALGLAPPNEEPGATTRDPSCMLRRNDIIFRSICKLWHVPTPDRRPGQRCQQSGRYPWNPPLSRIWNGGGPHTVAVTYTPSDIRTSVSVRSRFPICSRCIDCLPPARRRLAPAVWCGVEQPSCFDSGRLVCFGKRHWVRISARKYGEPAVAGSFSCKPLYPVVSLCSTPALDRLRIFGPVHIYVYDALRYHVLPFLETLSRPRVWHPEGHANSSSS